MTESVPNLTIEPSTVRDRELVDEERADMDPLVVVLAEMLKIVLEEEGRAPGHAA